MDLKNRFTNDSSSGVDYSVKTIWNTAGKLLQEKCHDEYKLTFNPFCDVVPNVCLNCSFGNLSRQIQNVSKMAPNLLRVLKNRSLGR
jgi:hypothetical protein